MLRRPSSPLRPLNERPPVCTTKASSASTLRQPARAARRQKSFSSPYPAPKAGSNVPSALIAARRMSMQKPTPVGRSGYEGTALAGDRVFAEDEAIVGGLGRFRGHSVMVIGTEKGRDTESR